MSWQVNVKCHIYHWCLLIGPIQICDVTFRFRCTSSLSLTSSSAVETFRFGIGLWLYQSYATPDFIIFCHSRCNRRIVDVRTDRFLVEGTGTFRTSNEPVFMTSLRFRFFFFFFLCSLRRLVVSERVWLDIAQPVVFCRCSLPTDLEEVEATVPCEWLLLLVAFPNDRVESVKRHAGFVSVVDFAAAGIIVIAILRTAVVISRIIDGRNRFRKRIEPKEWKGTGCRCYWYDALGWVMLTHSLQNRMIVIYIRIKPYIEWSDIF